MLVANNYPTEEFLLLSVVLFNFEVNVSYDENYMNNDHSCEKNN